MDESYGRPITTNQAIQHLRSVPPCVLQSVLSEMHSSRGCVAFLGTMEQCADTFQSQTALSPLFECSAKSDFCRFWVCFSQRNVATACSMTATSTSRPRLWWRSAIRVETKSGHIPTSRITPDERQDGSQKDWPERSCTSSGHAGFH